MTAEEHLLTERVLRYQRTREGLEELLTMLAGKIYGYPRLRGSLSEDDGGEFYLFFYPRLLRTLNKFQDQGRPFEWYLHSVLRWHYLGFVRWKRRRERNWTCGALRDLWMPPEASEPPAEGRIEEVSACPRALPAWLPPEVAEVFALRPGVRLARSADRKRLLIWILKQARRLQEADAPTASEWTGFPAERLRGAWAELKGRLERRELRLGLLVERRNRAFAALRLTEQALEEESDPAARASLHRRLDAARRCLHRSQERIARVPLEPSNREVALALGLPKGTVDTSLYWLKRRLMERNQAEAA